MTKKRYVMRSSEVAARRLGDEMMIMSGRDSTLVSLNDMASIIWEAADGSVALEDIVKSKICAVFEVEPAEALRDADALADGLAEHGVLLLSDEPFGSASLGQRSK